MKTNYQFRSTHENDYSYPNLIMINKKIETFMNHLKDSFDYDQIAVYTYDYINEHSDMSIIHDAINFILTATHKEFDHTHCIEFKERLFNYSKKIQVVRLTRYYERHEEHHYLFINNHFENNDVIITIPVEFNYIGILRCHLINLLTSDQPFVSRHRRNSLYEDCSQYVIFKESYEIGAYFEVICEINMTINHYCPLLTYQRQDKYSEFELGRKAQLVIRRWLTTSDYKCDYMINIRLIKGREIIKESTFREDLSIQIQSIVDQFIFPLADSYEDIKELNLSPELTAEFMSQDFTDFWDLKMMVTI